LRFISSKITTYMSSNKVILVLGATGAQGGSVVNALLKDNLYKVRALTRNANSEKAKELKSKGVEVIEGDYSKVDDLRKALKGVYGFFAMTNFWDPASMGKEVELGKLQVDTAKEAGVQHFIWSTLANVRELSKGKWNVPHLTDKAVVEEYARKSGLHCTFVSPPFYYQNLFSFFPPKKESDGTYVWTMPMPEDRYLTAFDVDDTGAAVATAFNHPQEWKNINIPLAGEHDHPQNYIKTLGKVLGIKTRYNAISVESFAKLGFPGAEELAQMFGWFNEFKCHGPGVDLSVGRKANPKLKTFEEYVKICGWRPQE